MSLSQDLQYAIELARGAGKIVMSHFGQTRRLTKTHAATTNEAVTDADRASQRFIVSGLKRRFPDDGIIGEENERGDAITFDLSDPLGRVWVIDPIDGTNNFIGGFPGFAVCIGLLDQGKPVLGIVFDVCRDAMFASAQGHGTWLDARQIRVAPEPLDDGSLIMLTSNLLGPGGQMPAYPARWLGQTNWKIRVLGSAALEAAYVAAGVAHGAITVNGKLWDCVAPAALVIEAGGVVTNLSGQSIFPYDLRNYVGAKVPYLAATPLAHRPLLEEIAR